MQGGVGGVKLETLVRLDEGLLPAAVVQVVVDLQHVVSLDGTEHVGVVKAGLLFEDLFLLDLEVVGKEGLLHGGEAEAWRLAHEAC